MKLLTLLTSSWLSKRKTQLPSLFYCSPQTFQVICNHTNPPRLLWPLHFLVFILHHNPLLIINPQNSAHETIGPKFKDFYFCTKLCFLTNSRLLFSNIYQMNYEKIQPKHAQTKYFWYHIWAFLFCMILPQLQTFSTLDETLKLQTFESANFKYDSSFLELQHKKNQQNKQIKKI